MHITVYTLNFLNNLIVFSAVEENIMCFAGTVSYNAISNMRILSSIINKCKMQ